MTPEQIARLAEVLPSVRVRHRCPHGKRTLPNGAAAVAEAKRISRRQARSGPSRAAQAFRCRTCGGWHVGRPQR